MSADAPPTPPPAIPNDTTLEAFLKSAPPGGLAPVKEDKAGEMAAEGGAAKPAEAKPEGEAEKKKEGEAGATPAPAAAAGGTGVPKPQAPPMYRRPAAPPVGHYDLISELNPRFEEHIPIPLKTYPEIPWRLVLCGPGPGPSPLTHIERESGAAVLVRTIQRTIHRKPSAPAAQTREQTISAELKRLEAALAAARKAEAAAAEAPPSPNISNIPVPPSPGLSEKNETPLPPAADLRIKVSDLMGPKTVGNTTPQLGSPTQPTSEMDAAPKAAAQANGNGLQVVVEGEVAPPPPPPADNPAAKEVAEVAKVDKPKEVEPAEEIAPVPPPPAPKEDDKALKADANADANPEKPKAEGEPAPAAAEAPKGDAPKPAEPAKDAKPEIGIHCWVIGATQEEVDDAANSCRALIARAIQEYEDAFTDIEEDEEEDGQDEAVNDGDKLIDDLQKLQVDGEELKPIDEKDVLQNLMDKALMT